METEKKGNSINGLMITSVVINCVIELWVFTDPELSGLGFIMLPFLLLSIAGLIISNVSKDKAGPILVIIGCIAFVPIGLIGMFGARKAMDELKREQFANEPKHYLKQGNLLPAIFKCPNCSVELDLDKNERINKKFTCPSCNKNVDLGKNA